MAKRSKILRYRRVVFADSDLTMQQLLARAARNLPNVEDRSFRHLGKVYEGLKIDAEHPESGVFIDFVTYTEGEQASIVRQQGEQEGELDVANAPEGSEYMDGNMFLFVKGDHLFFCASRLYERAIDVFLMKFIEEAGLDCPVFELKQVTNEDTLRLLLSEGVKRVTLNTTIYKAAYDRRYQESVSPARRGLSTLVGALGLADERDMDEAAELEKMSVTLSIGTKGKIQEEDFRVDRLDELTEDLLEENVSDFSILTKKGTLVKSGEISLSRKVNLEKYGNTVFRNEAWRALEDYCNDLLRGGV